MVILIVIAHVIACFFLIAVILLQAGRGQGLSWGVFGGTPQSILGTKTASFLSRVTTGCAIIFMFTCLALNIIETKKSRSLIAPTKPISQMDITKIKQALEKAEQTAKTETAPNAAAPPANQTAATANSNQPAPTEPSPPESTKPNP